MPNDPSMIMTDIPYNKFPTGEPVNGSPFLIRARAERCIRDSEEAIKVAVKNYDVMVTNVRRIADDKVRQINREMEGTLEELGASLELTKKAKTETIDEMKAVIAKLNTEA